MKTIIIEDELSAQLLLKNILDEYCPNITYLGNAASLAGSLELIEKTKTDIIFLDISLEDCTAFDILDAIDYNQYKIIFTTAYEEYASKAFRYEAIDYILKPYLPKDVLTAIDRVKTRDYNQQLMQKLADIIPGIKYPTIDKISIQSSKGIVFASEENIVHIEADGSYCKVCTIEGQEIHCSKSLKEIESQLSKSLFYRTHLSHLVNIDHIKEFQKGDGGSVILSNRKSVPVSRRKKSELLKIIERGIS